MAEDVSYSYTITLHGLAPITEVNGSRPSATRRAYELRTQFPQCDITVAWNYDGSEVLRLQAPQVGMPATDAINGDRYPGFISYVSNSGRKIGFTHKGNGPDVVSSYATLRKDGQYKITGCDFGAIIVGVAHDRLDPHF
jgi:hypothetical protein